MRFYMIEYMMRHMMILTHNHFFMLGLAITLAIGADLDTFCALLIGVPPSGAVDERFLLKTEDGVDGDALFIDLGRVEMRPRPTAEEGRRVGVRHFGLAKFELAEKCIRNE